MKFEANSTRNEFANNVILGVKMDGGVTLSPDAPAERNEVARSGKVDLGPIEVQ